MTLCRSLLVGILVCLGLWAFAVADDDGKKEKKKTVAGKADVMRHVQKKFAAFLGAGAEQGTVKLHIEGDSEPSTWPLKPDAEIKIRGWWGRLEQIPAGDRVWVWFAVDRKKNPRSVLLVADEPSEQVMHGLPWTLESIDSSAKTITIQRDKNEVRTLTIKLPPTIRPGDKLYVQSAGDMARLLLPEKVFHEARDTQRAWLRERWRAEGLAGNVSILHPLGGEMEVLLDHEAMRWGRHLKKGDAVTLKTAEPMKAVVKHVRPWRERTLVRLVSDSGLDQADLTMGQRVQVSVPEPPREVQASELPTDLDRPRLKDDRIEWFLASIYCPCKVKGDRCTGMAYTLASCNENACPLPNRVRKQVGELIDQDKTDRQILEELMKSRGPACCQQHLLR